MGPIEIVHAKAKSIVDQTGRNIRNLLSIIGKERTPFDVGRAKMFPALIVRRNSGRSKAGMKGIIERFQSINLKCKSLYFDLYPHCHIANDGLSCGFCFRSHMIEAEP